MSIIKQVSEQLWLIEVSLENFDVRGALIAGAERAVVWDTLSHPAAMEPIGRLIGDRELIVVYSHADWDHAWGTAGLRFAGKPVIGQATALARFAGDVPATLARKRAAEPGRWEAVRLIPPNVTFQRELTLDLGGLTLSLHSLAGHTPDSIVGFLPEQGILLAGDTMETPFPVTYEESPLDEWMAGWERWGRDSRVQTVIPAHGPIGGRDLIQLNLDYLRRIRAGGDFDLPADLNAFYREAHRRNVRHRKTIP